VAGYQLKDKFDCSSTRSPVTFALARNTSAFARISISRLVAAVRLRIRLARVRLPYWRFSALRRQDGLLGGKRIEFSDRGFKLDQTGLDLG